VLKYLFSKAKLLSDRRPIKGKIDETPINSKNAIKVIRNVTINSSFFSSL
jgi:hypothetical protein